ncbi:TorF family putative porin [Cellvibrio sp.]|uniref:TorF family putative porin n=1 Tax=Cellvibrio sp. TaxID=1965322 RepID=UPI0039648299
MKMKKLVAVSAALSALAGFAVPAAHAEVAASVSASNMYYWRGFDLGGGAALVADVHVSEAGFYTGLWASSGDKANGTEYDWYAGYNFDLGALNVDLNYTTYMYPTLAKPLGFDDVSDVAITLGYKVSDDLSFKAMFRNGVGDVLADDNYTYTTLSATYGKFTALVGRHSDDSGALDGVTHLDLSYAYSDKLSFTLGKVVDKGTADAANDELKFIATLSLPIK